jgi:hypothetical protein
MKSLIIGASLAVIASVSAVVAQQTGDQSGRVARGAFEQSIELRVAARRTQRLAAFGGRVFCDCLSAALPTDVDFQRYITVMTNPAVQSASEQAIRAARDKCVASAFPSER